MNIPNNALLLPHLVTVLLPLLATWFFRRLLLQQDQNPSLLSELSFATILFLSIHMHLLILLDIFNLGGSPELRVQLMRFSLMSVTILTFSVIPMGIITSLSSRVVIQAILAALFAYSVNELGNVIPLMANTSSVPPTPMEQLIARASFLGVTFMALISGFGAINAPIEYLSYFSLTPDGPSSEEKLKRKIVQTVESLSAKKYRMLLKMSRGDKQDPLDLEQISSVELLARDLYDELVAIKKAQRDLHFLKTTLIGRFSDFLGTIYLLYCVYKLFMSSINIIFDRDPKTDPITRGFEISLALIPLNINVEFWAQFISFLLVGILVFTSVRGFLLLTLQIFSIFAAPLLSDLILLTFTFVCGLYFVSSMILMRMNLPPGYRQILNDSLGRNYQFNLYHRWFDVAFVFGAVCTLFVIGSFRLKSFRVREAYLKSNEPVDPRLGRGRGSSILSFD